ncbi:tol-pal system-associated acyl-CoA thioesterase [Polymorphobacter glacialis]|uniref:Tol-pal system-associated acyl-CoA thioesterase n=1 Tax=Sandarakinorhabdus glacialis TaxID=1614636 RepID=A0A917E705_9SPHN|nr:YbgC/FadM family acyl-CoA thioesterase [Polymorphobacter glacialis]GGE06921.1 tol-pal system-associated acyl-CoA thioesterase [Polymorphobacter glacialis]
MKPFIPTNGEIIDGRHHYPVRVYFEDTDMTGIVYHANYLHYMERARTEMLRLSGVIHTEMMGARAGYYAVHSMNITWFRPARLDDELTVVSRVTKVRAAATCLIHDVMRGAELLCSGAVTAAFLDMDGRPRRQARDWHERFTLLMQQAATP